MMKQLVKNYTLLSLVESARGAAAIIPKSAKSKGVKSIMEETKNERQECSEEESKN